LTNILRACAALNGAVTVRDVLESHWILESCVTDIYNEQAAGEEEEYKNLQINDVKDRIRRQMYGR